MRTLKQQNNALADEASNAKFKLVDAQQEQLKLKGQIVEVNLARACSHLLHPVSHYFYLVLKSPSCIMTTAHRCCLTLQS